MVVAMSKKKFKQIHQSVLEIVPDKETVDLFMKKVAEIMKFDPDVGYCTPERLQKAKENYIKQRDKKKCNSNNGNGEDANTQCNVKETVLPN